MLFNLHTISGVLKKLAKIRLSHRVFQVQLFFRYNLRRRHLRCWIKNLNLLGHLIICRDSSLCSPLMPNCWKRKHCRRCKWLTISNKQQLLSHSINYSNLISFVDPTPHFTRIYNMDMNTIYTAVLMMLWCGSGGYWVRVYWCTYVWWCCSVG